MTHAPNPRAVIGDNQPIVVRPQEGAQAAFVGSEADIVIYGGAAGGGKSWGGVYCPTQYLHLPLKGMLFRRISTDIETPGGLLDETRKIYGDPFFGGVHTGNPSKSWRFPSGARIRLSHLQHEKDMYRHQGGQYDYMLFDELTHFEHKQFIYMMSRSRGESGVDAFIRATCNPDADSWVKEYILWWLDDKGQYARPDRSGVIRYLLRDDTTNRLRWADTRQELVDWWCERNPIDAMKTRVHKATGLLYYYKRPVPKSFTFIHSNLDDNPAMEEINAGYRASIMMNTMVEQKRLRDGDWLIREAAGNLFKKEWIHEVAGLTMDTMPKGSKYFRGYDFAATEKTPTNDPDWTTSTLLAIDPDKTIYICDHRYMQGNPGQVEDMVRNLASQDPRGTTICFPQDAGAGGVSNIFYLTKALRGYAIKSSPEGGGGTGDGSAKVVRFRPFSSQAYARNVKCLEGFHGKERLFGVLESFPDGRIDDDADSVSRAFNTMTEDRRFRLTRRALTGKDE